MLPREISHLLIPEVTRFSSANDNTFFFTAKDNALNVVRDNTTGSAEDNINVKSKFTCYQKR